MPKPPPSVPSELIEQNIYLKVIKKSTMKRVKPVEVHTPTVKKSAAMISSQCRRKNLLARFTISLGRGFNSGPLID